MRLVVVWAVSFPGPSFLLLLGCVDLRRSSSTFGCNFGGSFLLFLKFAQQRGEDFAAPKDADASRLKCSKNRQEDGSRRRAMQAHQGFFMRSTTLNGTLIPVNASAAAVLADARRAGLKKCFKMFSRVGKRNRGLSEKFMKTHTHSARRIALRSRAANG